jgi:parvulin-like peptidyl-prolyl isomerase
MVMNKMRDNMHVVLYVLVGAFVLLIVFEWGMDFTGFSNRRSEAGKVNGKPITLSQYETTYRQYTDNFRQRNQFAEISEQTEFQLRKQAWDFLVSQILLESEYEKLGLFVTDQEVVDEIYSDNPPAIIAQQFQDPKTGQINKEALNAAIAAPENKEVWIQVENVIRQQLMFQKFQDILSQGAFATVAEAREKFDEKNTKLSGSYVLYGLKRATPDSMISVSDGEIQDYFEAHKHEYKQEPVRRAKFVMFSNTATSEDTLQILNEMKKLVSEFATTSNDTEFVELQSDMPANFIKTFKRGSMSESADKALFRNELKVGDVIGPFQEFSNFKLVKILDIEEGEKVAHASHILLKPEGNKRADTLMMKVEARDLMRQIRKGADFAELAREKSDDVGSAKKGGSLGWFGKGKMVKPFEEAVFNAKPGALIGPVQSQFGVHIIKVHGFDSRQIRGAELVRKITASPATMERLERNADQFQYFATEEGFEKAAEADSLKINTSGQFTRGGFIPVIGFSNTVTNFAFKNNVGSISPVMQVSDGFVIMQITDKNDEGYRRLDDNLKETIRLKVIKEKQLDELRQLANKNLTSASVLEDLTKSDPELTIRSTGQVMLTNNFIPGLGREKAFVAAMANLEEGQLSGPIETSRGIAVVQCNSKVTGLESEFEADLTQLKTEIVQEKRQAIMSQWLTAMKKTAEIEDYR